MYNILNSMYKCISTKNTDKNYEYNIDSLI